MSNQFWYPIFAKRRAILDDLWRLEGADAVPTREVQQRLLALRQDDRQSVTMHHKLAFDDHPPEKRFSDRIETVTVDSVFSWLQRAELAGAPVVVTVSGAKASK